jgi:hypothetical protein
MREHQVEGILLDAEGPGGGRHGVRPASSPVSERLKSSKAAQLSLMAVLHRVLEYKQL